MLPHQRWSNHGTVPTRTQPLHHQPHLHPQRTRLPESHVEVSGCGGCVGVAVWVWMCGCGCGCVGVGVGVWVWVWVCGCGCVDVTVWIVCVVGVLLFLQVAWVFWYGEWVAGWIGASGWMVDGGWLGG